MLAARWAGGVVQSGRGLGGARRRRQGPARSGHDLQERPKGSCHIVCIPTALNRVIASDKTALLGKEATFLPASSIHTGSSNKQATF